MLGLRERLPIWSINLAECPWQTVRFLSCLIGRLRLLQLLQHQETQPQETQRQAIQRQETQGQEIRGSIFLSSMIEFEFTNKITRIWNAEIVNHIGDRYVIRDAGWNGEVAPNGSISFGFIGEGSVSSQPRSFELNYQH